MYFYLRANEQFIFFNLCFISNVMLQKNVPNRNDIQKQNRTQKTEEKQTGRRKHKNVKSLFSALLYFFVVFAFIAVPTTTYMCVSPFVFVLFEYKLL